MGCGRRTQNISRKQIITFNERNLLTQFFLTLFSSLGRSSARTLLVLGEAILKKGSQSESVGLSQDVGGGGDGGDGDV